MSATNVVSYTGDGNTQNFAVTFDFLRSTDLKVTVNGQNQTFTLNGTTVTLSSPPPNGATVVIQRVTDLTSNAIVFSDDGGFTADDLNDAINQCLYGAHDAHIRIDSINSGGGGGGGATVPTPTAADRMLVSKSNGQGGFEYQLQTVSQIQTLLGITTPVNVPSPLSGNRFLITNISTNTYELATISSVKTILGLPSYNLPAINGAANRILTTNSAGTGVNWQTASYVRDLMGLGTAALVNTGTAVGNVPTLVSGSGGAAALPAVSGENLTNVARAQDYAMWEKATAQTISPGNNDWVTITSTGGGASLTRVIDSEGTWNTSHTDGVQLDIGVYRLRAEAIFEDLNHPQQIRLSFTGGGTVSANNIASVSSGCITTSSNNRRYYNVEYIVRITGSAASLAVQARSGGGLIGFRLVRLHLNKIG